MSDFNNLFPVLCNCKNLVDQFYFPKYYLESILNSFFTTQDLQHELSVLSEILATLAHFI